ncbi:MAG: group 1 truncated hemoglobin [Ignavibacteriae bacterium]|nr:group 1 truncated hemoglobin [Ignavibacteriota bacterium]
MNVTRILSILCCSFVLFCLTTAQETKQKPLYQRLGGYDAIAAVVDDFIPKAVADPQLGKFFAGHGDDSKKKVRQLVLDQLCEATGGPCFYIGRSMKVAHGGLGITESDWTVFVNHLVATLDKFKVAQKEKDELLGVLTTLKADIVSAQGAGMKK